MIDISQITRLISALRAQTSANSITPEGLGSILQKITDLIGALSQIPEQEATDLISRVSQCESDCETARQAAQSAASLAAGNVLTEVEVAQTTTYVTITVTQDSGNSVYDSIPAATTSKAGVMSSTDKSHLDAAYNKRLKQLSTASYDDRVVLNYKCEDNTIKAITFVAATSLTAGLMSAADKVVLDTLDATVTTLSSTVNGISTKKANLEQNGAVPILAMSQWPRTVIRSLEPTTTAPEGEMFMITPFWEQDPPMLAMKVNGNIITLGIPSEHVVYVTRDTRKLYIWDTQVGFVEVGETIIINNLTTGGATVALSAQQGVELNNMIQLNEARCRNLSLAIKNAQDFSALKGVVSLASWNTCYPLKVRLTNCTLQESIPAYLGPMDNSTTVKVKARNGYELSVNCVTIYDGEGYERDNDITQEFLSEGFIQYDAGTGLLTVILEDSGLYEIFINATSE